MTALKQVIFIQIQRKFRKDIAFLFDSVNIIYRVSSRSPVKDFIKRGNQNE